MNEQKAIVAILQHTLHRINEFFDEYPVETFGEDSDPVTIAAVFVKWQVQQDSSL